MEEIWKPIKDYEGLYEVSNLGRVKSLDRIIMQRGFPKKLKGRILKGRLNRKGYITVILHSDGLPNTQKIHRLVALVFIKNPENKREVNHINGIKTDNRSENLEWNTTSENLTHAFKIGLKEGLKGGKNGRAKLTEDMVRSIKKELSSMTQVELAEKYGVSPVCISKIKLGINWKHI